MSKWNGTNLQTSWLRLKGAGRASKGCHLTPRPWFCAGCERKHGARVERNTALDMKLYCNREFYKVLDRPQGHNGGPPLDRA